MTDQPTPPTDRILELRPWLRLDGLAVMVMSMLIYSRVPTFWGWFAVLFFVPDLSMIGYLTGPRRGAVVYNLCHTYAGSALLAVLMHVSGHSWALPAIWTAHIGFDRAMGYGLKFKSGFGDTHMGSIGRNR